MSECPGRLGDAAQWCDTHGGTVALCLVCEACVTVTTWETPTSDGDVWVIGAHLVSVPADL